MWKRISDSLYSTRVVYTRLKKQRDVRATPVVLHLIKLFEYRSLSCYKQRIWSWCFLFQPDRIKVPSYFGASKKISSSHFSMADVSSEKKKKDSRLILSSLSVFVYVELLLDDNLLCNSKFRKFIHLIF